MKIKEFIDYLVSNLPIKLLCVMFAMLLFLYHKNSLLDVRYFSVPLSVENSSEFVPASSYPRVVRVSLRGDSTTIAPIHEENIRAYIDLDNITASGTEKLTVKYKLIGMEIPTEPIESSVEPKEISVRLEVNSKKKVNIKLNLNSNPPADYELIKTVVEPAIVEITGPQSAIERISELTTETISLENKTASFDGTATIVNTNQLVSLAENRVRYEVSIRETSDTVTFEDVPIALLSLDKELIALNDNLTTSVKVVGKKAFLRNWNLPYNFLSVDCSTIKEAGSYTLPIDFQELSNNEIEDIGLAETEIELTITSLSSDVDSED